MAYTPDVSMFPYFKSNLIDMKQELQELREFKKAAEETCASHVVMETMMDKNEELQTALDKEKRISERLHTVLEGWGKRECLECNKWDCRMMCMEIEDMSGEPAHVCYNCWEDIRDDYSRCTACGNNNGENTRFHKDNLFYSRATGWMCKKCHD